MNELGLPAILAIVFVAAILLVLVGVAMSRGRAPRRQQEVTTAPTPVSGGPQRQAAVIVNPTKFDDIASVRVSVESAFAEAGWATPLWLETTWEDTGTGQTQEALDAGVDLICPLGGDGTVRTVGEQVAGTGVPLGLLPGGTGNLLARNLGLPVDSMEDCLRIAIGGTDRVVDVVRLTVTTARPAKPSKRRRVRELAHIGRRHGAHDDADEDRDQPGATLLDDRPDHPRADDRGEDDSDADTPIVPDPGNQEEEREAVADAEAQHDREDDSPPETPPSDHTFLVMAGIGFDATVIAQAPEKLKAKMGAGAYVVSGMRNLYGPKFAVDIELDDQPAFHRRVRSVIVGNCGKLQGGLELLPDAKVDDGWIDIVLLSPQGVVGWAAVLARVVTKRRKGHERIDHHRCRKLVMRLNHPEEVQLDGDLIGPGGEITAAVEPHALVVRVG